MEIKIGIGIENLFFGMSEEEVREILGKPDKINEEEKVDGTVYYYNSKIIKLKFDKRQQCRLYSIEVHNPQMRMFGNNIFLKTQEEIEYYLKSNGYFDFEYYNYDAFETLFCKGIWTTFLFEFNTLRSLEFSPLIKNADGWVLPSK